MGRKKISILGATGSIGQSTAKVIAAEPDRFEVVAVTAQTRAQELAQMARDLGARVAVIGDERCYPVLRDALAGSGIEAACGRAAIEEAAAQEADIVMAAILGMAGLGPLMRAIAQGRVVAIANKEPLVAAGALVIAAAQRHGTTLLPVDSEHNAIFQVFDREHPEGISRLILTASGGPFREWSRERMETVTPAQAVAHPNWSMGAKISVDSATMMNKALEIIEARHLFAMPPEAIEVLIHPESMVHSMVEYKDGSILAQLGAPDMCTPIAFALGWPKRIATPGRRLDLKALTTLRFEMPDPERFPALRMAYEVLRAGPAACIAFNAANEVAVEAFLTGKTSFLSIIDIVGRAVEKTGDGSLETLEEVIHLDHTVRALAKSFILEQAA